jgi:hypothetical protein
MRTYWIAAMLVIAACDKGGDKSAAGSGNKATEGAEDTGARKDLVEAWKKGGLAVSDLAPEKVAFGTDCKKGTVGAIEVLVCQYASADEAKKQTDAGNAWIAENMFVGASQAHGPLLIVAADRQKSDPSGKTIQKMMSLAPK